MRLPLLLLILLLALCSAASAEPRFFLKDGERVLFLGDSNTQAGAYIQYLDAFLATRFPERRFELINLGLASETVSGLSEPDHPFPRPDVHERLQRALAKTKPDVVAACYGMNDGIYYPFAEERLAAYKKGVRRLIAEARAAGARVVLMTPPPFDPEPVRSKLLPAGAPKYSWIAPYEGYDEVLGRYSRWLLGLRTEGVPVVDLHGPVNRFVAEIRRIDPTFRLTGDGIHPNATGHWLLARELLRAWSAPREVDRAEVDDARTLRARAGQVAGLRRDGDGLRFEWTTRLPMAADPQWDRRLAAEGRGPEDFNRHVLVVRGLPGERLALYEGETRLGEVSARELSAGVRVDRFPELSAHARAAEVLKLVRQRRQLLDPAWLSAVGHQRPGVRPGRPLEEARRQAAALEGRIRELAAPVTLRLWIRPL